MKVGKNNIVRILLVLCVCLVSCEKYLEKKSDSSLVVPTTIEDLQALLDFTEQINTNTPLLGEVSCDDNWLLEATYNTRPQMDRDAYRWLSFDYSWPNDWSAGYQPVYTSNLCLEGIEKVSKTPQNEIKWNNVKGTALFLRAYHFLNLAWVYAKAYDNSSAEGDLGIVLRLSSDFNVQSKRATVKETYERVIKDTKESVDYLPDNPQHVMRPSKAAAYGLLARTYLSMRQYDSALKFSNLALSIKNTLLDYNIKSEVDVTSNTPFKPFNKETIFFSQPVTAWLTTVVASFALVDSTLYSSYSTNDLRRSAFYRPQSGYQRYKNLYTGTSLIFSGIATDEMYLTRAECFARSGKKDEALADLNTLLGKRWATGFFVPVTAASSQEALNIVLVERRKELVRRGLRWIDIKRLNKEGAGISLKRIVGGQTYSLPPNDNRYALPLPKDIITTTGMEQN